MAKASPGVRSFNAGEFSALLDGRVDLDRYPASTREMLNYIAAPQGPAIGRSGTQFVSPTYDEAQRTALVPFVFSADQARMLEFSEGRIRFFSENGLQVYAPEVCGIASAVGTPIQFNSATLGASIGDEVVFSFMPSDANLNGEPIRILNKVGTVYTLNKTTPATSGALAGSVARVYHVACSYNQAERLALRVVQSVDVLYLFTGLSQPRKLSRYGEYDWRLTTFDLLDGPYMPINETTTTLTPSATGNAVAVLSSDAGGANKASGSTFRAAITGTKTTPVEFLGRDITYTLAVANYYKAFDADDESYWASSEQQKGTLVYEPAVAFVADGYTIYVAKDNQDTSYSAKDYAPSSWTFEGWDGSAWVELDRQDAYVLYDGMKSVFFPVLNSTAYLKYRIVVTSNYRNGLIETRIRRLVIRGAANVTFNLVASSVTGINNDTGFKATDVGRLVRLKCDDGAWRSCKITTFTNTLTVGVTLLGEPLTNTKAIREWRLGYYSDTTGWPGTGVFLDDRLWLGGSTEAPDLIAGSVTGAYDTFSQTDGQGVVLDDSGIALRLNSRRLSRIEWIAADARGLLTGTGSEEYTLKGKDNDVLTARNPKARPATRRGSSSVEPVSIDNQVLFVQRGGRTLREMAYVYEADAYKTPSMSQLAGHISAVPIEQLAYAQEPHSVVWARLSDGSLVGMTYNRDENVVGWHRHDLAGGYVESIATIPQSDARQDALWLVVRRVVNGVTRRYVERLTRFWDFDTTLDEAHYVDCALRYTGSAVNTVYGLQHLEGLEVYGLADRKEIGPYVVSGGKVTLPFAASNIVVGLGYEARCVLPRLENGAADGTAQGKTKRINSIALMVWRSVTGEIGLYNAQAQDFVYETIKYPGDFDAYDELDLYTGVIAPITPTPGYDMDGFIAFRRPASSPMPFNVVSVLPQLNTQDR